MKKIMVALTMIFISLFLVASTGLGYTKVLGYYSFIGDTIYAVNESVCLHEIAHKADFKDAGFSGKWISASSEWLLAIENSKAINQGATDIDRFILNYQGEITELYADIYMECVGHDFCIPEELHPFYDFGLLYNLRIERCNGY